MADGTLKITAKNIVPIARNIVSDDALFQKNRKDFWMTHKTYISMIATFLGREDISLEELKQIAETGEVTIKRPVGRPVKNVIEPIKDSPENVAQAIMMGVPKKKWKYFKE